MYDTNLLMGLFKMLSEQKLDRPKFYQMLVRAVVQEMAVSRAAVWFYQGDLQDRLVCESLYDLSDNQWSSGMVLGEDDFGPYFAAMRDVRQVVAVDARSDPITACFNDSLLEPLNIYSVLSLPIELDGRQLGLVSCEQTSQPRDWSTQDIQYLKQVAAMIGLLLKKLG
ncbi:GAF domain-containing protein [Chitinimonas lacunae]|uniref:GAF domain-containing protein n=1 Tax=Chitinimonas lacunae TaxID=1963018 RepID=A0ABV8MIE3_9NEIS